jgi:hypothetical protein
MVLVHRSSTLYGAPYSGQSGVSAGANVKALQQMLGHAKASMTLDVYADLFDDDLDSVADGLDAALRSVSAGPLSKATNARVTAIRLVTEARPVIGPNGAIAGQGSRARGTGGAVGPAADKLVSAAGEPR